MSGKYAFFKGCFVPVRLPWVEKATYRTLGNLGISLVDLDEFTCCPEPVGVGIVDNLTWLAIAARNLAIAEERNLDIMTVCNGCTYTLRNTIHKLNEDKELKDKVNDIIADTGHSYKGNVKVYHFIEVLRDDVGIKKLKNSVKRPLSGLTIATHTGCHILSPKEVMKFDNPFDPTTLDEFVAALGATPADYDMKTLCCGWALMTYGAREGAYRLLGDKLGNIKDSGADCLTVICPQCFYQFDMGQFMASRKDIPQYNLPVFFFLQLLDLAMGASLEEVGYTYHKIQNLNVVNKLKRG
ncbi:MAG: heterodisulfide reductase-related iron-sulfur binding cluster [Candidatus Bathyarchaeia archaeon]